MYISTLSESAQGFFRAFSIKNTNSLKSSPLRPFKNFYSCKDILIDCDNDNDDDDVQGATMIGAEGEIACAFGWNLQ